MSGALINFTIYRLFRLHGLQLERAVQQMTG